MRRHPEHVIPISLDAYDSDTCRGAAELPRSQCGVAEQAAMPSPGSAPSSSRELDDVPVFLPRDGIEATSSCEVSGPFRSST